MKKFLMFAGAAVLSTGFIASASAAGNGTKEEAIALVNKAVAFYEANGKEKAYAEFSKAGGQFTDRDLYVYVMDTSGVVHAHGANAKLIGKNLIALKDADGKPFVAELVEVIKANKAGWVDYKWSNPTSKKIEQKTTYVLPAGDIGFAVGVYK